MGHRSGSIYHTFSVSHLCGGRHSGQHGRKLPDRLNLLSVLLYFGQTCLLGMDIDSITPAQYTVYGVREGGGSR